MSPKRSKIEEGVYRIYQEQPGRGRVEVTQPFNPSEENLNTIITTTELQGKGWMIRKQPGIETLFTIRPRFIPGLDAASSQYWGLHATDTLVDLHYSSYTSLWSIECEPSVSDNEPRIYSKCRIVEAGTNKYWFTNDKNEIQLINNTNQDSPEPQFYELQYVKLKNLLNSLDTDKPAMTVSSYEPLTVKGNGDIPIKRLYFGINKVDNKDTDRYMKLCLETDACYLGSPDHGESHQTESVSFELAILTQMPAEKSAVEDSQIKKTKKGQLIIRESHRLLPRENSCYHRVVGQASDDLIPHLRQGDSIGVLVCVQGIDAGCTVRSGRLTLYETYDYDE